MGEREFKNNFKYSLEDSPEDIKKRKDLLTDSRDNLIKYLEDPPELKKLLNIDEIDEGDISVYTGKAGIALLYLKLGKIDKAEKLILKCEKKLRQRRVTFLEGDSGVLAIAAVVMEKLGKTSERDVRVKKVVEMAEQMDVLNAKSDLPDELLYGRSGYLFSLLYLRHHLGPHVIDHQLVKQVTDAILNSGKNPKKMAKQQIKKRAPLMYQWHDKVYIGAAHGLSGILVLLLQAKDFISEEDLNHYIRPTVDFVAQLAFESGNFPSSLTNDRDRLVAWCHGAPGVANMLLLAYKVWGEQKYLDLALRGGEVVFERGLLKKGYGLCHGTAGNGYLFLHLYQVTKDLKYKYYADMFGLWCSEYGTHGCRVADHPLSLFEGLAGTIYFIDDLLIPDDAKFPAFIL